jgi:hypothetical protein
MKDKLRAAHEKLQQAVTEIASGDDWKRMLQVVSRFHRYSFNNHLMIFCQRPDATVVAGFNRWKSLGRFVKKGEKGIAIFAPCRYKTKVETEDGDEKSCSRYGASVSWTSSTSHRRRARSCPTSVGRSAFGRNKDQWFP